MTVFINKNKIHQINLDVLLCSTTSCVIAELLITWLDVIRYCIRTIKIRLIATARTQIAGDTSNEINHLLSSLLPYYHTVPACVSHRKTADVFREGPPLSIGFHQPAETCTQSLPLHASVLTVPPTYAHISV